jgi:CyaY protein
MSDNEFLDLVDRTLLGIETAIENSAAEVDAARSGNVLALEFDDGTKIIINSQVALHELWVAARSGGFHFRHEDGAWHDTRDHTELFAALSGLISSQTGAPVALVG